MLWRLWLPPDRRFIVAALGIAFAILLPVAGTLVLQGLDANIDEGQWIAYRADGRELPILQGMELGVRFEDEAAGRVAAIVVGDPLLGVQESNQPGFRTDVVSVSAPSVIPEGVALVHPGSLQGRDAHVAILSRDADVPGVVIAPVRGADAFEQAGLESLQAQTLFLILASVPAVALVTMAFGDQEARRRARSAATLAAMGRPELGRRILVLRVAWLMVIGTTLSVLLGYLFWRFGGAAFKPEDAKPLGIAIAIIVPAAIGGLAGMFWAAKRLGSGEERLRTPPSDADVPGRRWGFLPVPLRPLMIGGRLMPLLVIAGLLFAMDLGFPVAAASVPAAIAGEEGEWVVGADVGITIGGNVDAAAAGVAWIDDDVEDIVAEIMLPTLLKGQAILVRGGDLPSMARYHDAAGIPADATGLWLSDRVADRLNVRAGDVISIQAAHQAQVQWLPVEGTYRTNGILRDEAILDAETARELAGVAPGKATLLRVWPDSDEARNVVARSGSDIRVLDVRYSTDSPVSGERLGIEIDVANVAGGTGQRVLPVRVNGNVATEVTATMGPWSRATLEASIVVPIGPFQVSINPTQRFDATDAGRIDVPRISFGTDAIPVATHGLAGDIQLWLDDRLIDAAPGPNATLTPDAAGNHTIRVGGHEAGIIVAPEANRDVTLARITSAWMEPARPRTGEPVTLYIEATNFGGRPGPDVVTWTYNGNPNNETYSLVPGQSAVRPIYFTAPPGGASLRVGDQAFEIGSTAAVVTKGVGSQFRTGTSLQVEVADRVLGDAQRSLVGLATIALASILSVVYLGTERTLQGRGHVLKILHALGMTPEQIRYRAAWEAGIQAGLVFIGAAIIAKLAFRGLGWIGWPLPFSHSLPDPIGWIFLVQAGAAFAGAAGLAGYLASGKVVAAFR